MIKRAAYAISLILDLFPGLVLDGLPWPLQRGFGKGVYPLEGSVPRYLPLGCGTPCWTPWCGLRKWWMNTLLFVLMDKNTLKPLQTSEKLSQSSKLNQSAPRTSHKNENRINLNIQKTKNNSSIGNHNLTYNQRNLPKLMDNPVEYPPLPQDNDRNNPWRIANRKLNQNRNDNRIQNDLCSNIFEDFKEEFLIISPKGSYAPNIEDGEDIYCQLHEIAKVRREDISDIRDRKLLVKVSNKKNIENLMKIKKLIGHEVSVERHPRLNQSQGTIYAPSLISLTEEKLLNTWKRNSNVVSVRRFTKIINGERVNTNTLLLTFDSLYPPEFINWGYQGERCKHYISVYYPKVQRCFNCNKLGHLKRFCRGSQTCLVCSDPFHGQDCDKTPRCTNCHQAHKSNSTECPRYQLEKKIIKLKTDKKLRYKYARYLVLRDNPDLKDSYAKRVKTNNTQTKPVNQSFKDDIKSSNIRITPISKIPTTPEKSNTNLTNEKSSPSYNRFTTLMSDEDQRPENNQLMDFEGDPQPNKKRELSPTSPTSSHDFKRSKSRTPVKGGNATHGKTTNKSLSPKSPSFSFMEKNNSQLSPHLSTTNPITLMSSPTNSIEEQELVNLNTPNFSIMTPNTKKILTESPSLSFMEKGTEIEQSPLLDLSDPDSPTDKTIISIPTENIKNNTLFDKFKRVYKVSNVDTTRKKIKGKFKTSQQNNKATSLCDQIKESLFTYSLILPPPNDNPIIDNQEEYTTEGDNKEKIDEDDTKQDLQTNETTPVKESNPTYS